MYKLINKDNFIKDLEEIKTFKGKFRIFYDIETYQYNEDKGKEKPTYYNNCIYSFAISYYLYDDLKIVIFKNVKEFFDCFLYAYHNIKTLPTFELIAHNSNKYDNHFLRKDLLYYYNLDNDDLFLNNASEKANLSTLKIKDIKNKKIDNIILEKRVKSRNNLELVIFLKNIQFVTVDNFMKTHTSIATLGKKLLRLGVITDEELKTDFNYTKYNVKNNMTEEQAKAYAEEIFNNLDKDELKYIVNDVVILAKSMYHYSEIFKGYDYNRITFTSNILESYNQNNLTSYQLLKSVGKGKYKVGINYTDYSFSDSNLYDYLKSFYNGGLNFYNYREIGKVIDTGVFGIDINSSYPYVMYAEKIPTYFHSYREFKTDTMVSIKDIEKQKDTFTIYRLSKDVFDYYIVTRIESDIVKELLVKYYGKRDHININSNTFKLIETITPLKISEIPVLSYITFECVYFGARDILEENYKIKTQGQNKYKMNMDNLYNIYETEEKSDVMYSDEEIDISKLNLNGLYGIPALRPYFNIFRWHNNKLTNIENGFENNQRNVLFSVFVTSVALYNLLEPLKYLTQEEIDKYFLYCDTDSLYLKIECYDKLPKHMFDSNNLGSWDIQNEYLEKFYVLNHKKYCYQENGKIEVKCGGVPQSAFNTNVSFEEFIKEQFSNGVVIENQKSIYNENEVISIYPSHTRLELGSPYFRYSNNEKLDEKRKQLLENLREEFLNDNNSLDDTLYIESNIGTFSVSEIFEVEHPNTKSDIRYCIIKEEFIRTQI